MNLETIVNAFVGLGFGVILFLIFVWAVARRIQIRVDSDLEGIMEKLAQDRLIALTVEIDNNQYFCYNALTKDFVCQGYSLKEIVERFRLRYPNKAAAIYDGDETAVRTLRNQMKDIDENLSSQ
jgi:hypothetical protein